MSDGPRLRQSWYNALNDAETHFRQLLTSPSSSEWKRVPNPGDGTTTPTKKGKARVSTTAFPELSDVVVHRNSSVPGDDVYRLTLDVPTGGGEYVSLEPWKAVLATPELRQEWDPAVEEAHLVETFDRTTKICKTKFTLGWPANPRDAVTISRSFHDATTVIDISTSLPRSTDEPAYLRPAPPYVRSNVTLFAWCIQHVQPSPPTDQPVPVTTPKRKTSSGGGRLRITCFWQHDLKALWGFSSSTSLVQQLSTMTLGLLKTVTKRGTRIPMLLGYGNGVTIEKTHFQIDREALTVEYAIIPEDEDRGSGKGIVGASEQGVDELHAIREGRRLTRAVECVLPAVVGWEVQVVTRASSEEVEQLPWSANAVRSSSLPSPLPSSTTPSLPSSSAAPPSSQPDQIILRLSHAPLIDDHSVLKVKLTIEFSGPTTGLRMNGLPHAIRDEKDERDPKAYFMSQQILQDVSSTAELSFRTVSSAGTATSVGGGSVAGGVGGSMQTLVRPGTVVEGRTPAAEKSVASRVRRSYIYFSSLLQEPEAKWRRTTEARGVSITQLDSIDPTLVVYRAEATFVGVGLWDLYGAVVSPGAKIYWDKQHEDAVLLEDVNELTELWHYKTRPAWPVNGRDSVVLKTVYKSPTTIHVFSFSADDSHLFPSIPPAEPNVIRTQIDLQGWAIEALSPTTTLLTLLEQSDMKGWTSKTSVPAQMISALAGIGEFAIKCGGPPVVTRLAGARVREMRYEHERGSFKVEYEVALGRRGGENGGASGASVGGDAGGEGGSGDRMPVVECEIRCDVDTWATSLDIVVDPPPQGISCLRRHRLSAEGGGLWVTLTHDAVLVDEERLLMIVRRAPNGKEKGLVMVNGARVAVDVEELMEHEIRSLAKQKRVKPPRIPLDQPPVMGVIRRRKAEWDAEGSSEAGDAEGSNSTKKDGEGMTALGGWATAPRISSPLARFFTYAVDQAASASQQAVAAISPAGAALESGTGGVPSPLKAPMEYALEALAWTQDVHSRSSSSGEGEGWVLVSEKGMLVHRKLVPEISSVFPVHKGSKVIEGVSAEELASVIRETECRKTWDDRFDSACVFESFGGESKTSFLTAKGGFLFRDRGFYLASVMARAHIPASLSRRNTSRGDVAEQSNGARNAIFCVSASFSPDSVAAFAPGKYNPYVLPIGRVYVDAWILETLDPYTKENYAIPSARCTRLVAVDHGGSIPAAVNAMINAGMPRAVLAVETYVKGIAAMPLTRLPTPGLVVVDRKGEGEGALVGCAWRLRKRDEGRVLVGDGYSAEEKVYRARILVGNLGNANSNAQRPKSGSVSGGEQTTPRPSQVMPRRNSLTRGGEEGEISGLPTGDLPAAMPTLGSRERTLSSASPSHDALSRGRASSSAFTVKGEVRPSTDLIVAELVVDSKLYPDGYDIVLRSRMRSGLKVGVRRQQVPIRSTMGDGDTVLPLAYTIYTVPSSPLHSSGLTTESPTRHLLRLTLPTAQYQISTVKDPLTGETQSAPPKPEWLVELQEGGAVVDIEVRPADEGNKTKGSVRVDGKEVKVIGEKESLTNLGREELLDDRLAKMGVLSRVLDEAEPLPDELTFPVAVADDLLDPVVVSSSTPDGHDPGRAEESGSTSLESSEETAAVASEPLPTPQPPHAVPAGLLGFLQSPLTRFGGTGPTTTGSPRKVPGELDLVESAPAALYPLSTVVIVALIAFLIGSLLRSLLSPADFFYVVSDAEDQNVGWREIRRLVEVKYIMGGWDFQIAVVRRH